MGPDGDRWGFTMDGVIIYASSWDAKVLQRDGKTFALQWNRRSASLWRLVGHNGRQSVPQNVGTSSAKRVQVAQKSPRWIEEAAGQDVWSSDGASDGELHDKVPDGCVTENTASRLNL